MTSPETGERRRRSPVFLIGLTLIAFLFSTGFGALGVWQVQRLAWKQDLIARVDARLDAPPVTAPPFATRADEYRRVSVFGHFLHDRAVLVQAVTVRGAGFWVLTPLVTGRGFTLIINRGFVPADERHHYDRPPGEVRIAGLMRLSEPGGGFLRSNDPAADRWYSRDVAAIATVKKVSGPVANYFVDAGASPSPDTFPIGGLTVVTFPNNHLSYAITWFVLAAMVAAAYIFAMRQEWKARHG
ncbi:SURF1 family protein [Sphingobium bisphenolivorans]|uniref:SURF1 family protein n=1 Tax=Sphingobium bisphenolivorans TaxID=1335760 RepID=UPI00039DB330|nr:SURF1 family protein [Sphingobium bisphenolivorans]